jgi:hypothetical protein
MSQQRFHDPDASLPSTGSARARVPLLRRYYQGTPTPVSPPAALRCLRLAVPRDHALFRSRHTCASACRARSLVTRYPARVFFRGADRFSQVSGEPQFPFAHGLRPRPADLLQTFAMQSHGPRYTNDEGADDQRLSRLNNMAFGLTVYVSRRWSPVAAQDSLPGAGQAFPDGISTRRAPTRGFQLTSCSSSSSSRLAWHNRDFALSHFRD